MDILLIIFSRINLANYFIFMSSNNITFKKTYSLFIATSLVFLFTLFFVPQKASAQAFVPVNDAELNAAFKLFVASSIGSAGGGTYPNPLDPANPIVIAAEICSTSTLPGNVNLFEETWYSGKESSFNLDLNGNNIVDPNEVGVYREDYVFVDRDATGATDGVKEWLLEPMTQKGDVYYTRSRVDSARSPKQEDPGKADYYDDPKNPYFFLPNYDEMSPTNAGINDSTSINCLLQEMVEWEKLRINMEMHGMIKEYFTDAQTYALSQQLLSTLAAATIKWSNEELEQKIYINGVATTTKGAIYGDPNSLEGNIAAGADDEIRGGLVGGNDLGINPPEQDLIAKTVEDNIGPKDPFEETRENVKYIAPPAGNSPEEEFAYAVRNSALNVTGILVSDTAQRMAQAADKQKSRWETYGGYLSEIDCGSDPYCRDPEIITPGNILGQKLYEATQSGNEALKVADELGESTGTSSQELSYQLQQRSLRDYDVQQLMTNQQTPRELFNEFEFVLTNYYGVNEGTTAWSRNMLINTWDDIMWGSGAVGNAEDLGKRLDDIIDTVDNYGS